MKFGELIAEFLVFWPLLHLAFSVIKIFTHIMVIQIVILYKFLRGRRN